MLMIRLARFGAKKKPSYRVVVIEKERARDSRSVEVVGTYNPVRQPAEVKLEHERIEYWMKRGAQPSETVSRVPWSAAEVTETVTPGSTAPL